MLERFSEGARKVYLSARDVAVSHRHHYVGSEDLLLAILQEENPLIGNAFNKTGVQVNQVKDALAKIIEEEESTPVKNIDKRNMPITPRLSEALKTALTYTRVWNTEEVGTEHLLLGIMNQRGGAAYEVLESLGVKLEDFERAVYQLTKNGADIQTGFLLNWVIPRSSMNLAEVLRKYNFGLPTKEGEVQGIFGRTGSTRNNLLVGNIDDKNQKVKVIYDPKNEEQIREALYLREVFDVNGQPYDEFPPSSEVAERLREPLQKQLTLAAALERNC